mgnify:CR=1 FL=1
MKTLKFKTSLKCQGCVNAITPYMNEAEGVKSWRVDLDSPEKWVEIDTDDTMKKKSKKDVEKAIKTAGYQAKLVKQ